MLGIGTQMEDKQKNALLIGKLDLLQKKIPQYPRAIAPWIKDNAVFVQPKRS